MNTDKTENQTIEKSDNELIAEFMAAKIDGSNYLLLTAPPHGFSCDHWHGTLYYNTRWDWLMPVVEKIETLDNGYDTRICFHADGGDYFCDIVDEENTERACQVNHKSKIEAVYKACLEFISWYNSQKVKTDTEV